MNRRKDNPNYVRGPKLTEEELTEVKRIKRDIRLGKLPSRHFTKTEVGGKDRLERNAKGKLTWNVQSTLSTLTKK